MIGSLKHSLLQYRFNEQLEHNKFLNNLTGHILNTFEIFIIIGIDGIIKLFSN